MLGTNLSTSSPYISLSALFDAYLVRRDLDAALPRSQRDIYSLGTCSRGKPMAGPNLPPCSRRELHWNQTPIIIRSIPIGKEVAPGFTAALSNRGFRRGPR